MSIGEHGHCCHSKYKDLYGKKTYRFCITYENERISIKSGLPPLKCVLRLSCVVHGPIYGRFMGFYVINRFSLYIKVYQGWGLQQSCPTDPPKENGRNFAPTTAVASKFRLGNTQYFSFPFVFLLQDAFVPRANQRSQICTTFPVGSHRQNLGLNSALPLKDSDAAWNSNYSHSGWETVSCSSWHQYTRKKTTGARDCLPPRVLFSNIHWKVFTPRSKKRLETSKHPLNGDSDIFLFESIEGWSKKRDKTSKQTSDKSEYTIDAKPYKSNR